eukprot:gb/GECH01000081.1/.p1 GENE.gb/GECH01000081.1/~~gb/GECH01000081.1/.p1  ORF type:complete len:717 (+),score=133.10 gb/GECH01000081.1/:1-2151(+)
MTASQPQRFVQKRVYPYGFDVDFQNPAIIVLCDVEAAVLNEDGEVQHVEKRKQQKRIQVKGLSENSDIWQLSGDMVEGSHLIHHSRREEIFDLLLQLQKHSVEQGQRLDGSRDVEEVLRRKHERETAEEARRMKEASQASMDDLESYLEMLYDDDHDTQISGASKIKQLAREDHHLEELAANPALLGALQRVLREEGHHSLTLATHVMYTLYRFSHYSKFHAPLRRNDTAPCALAVLERQIRYYFELQDGFQQKTEEERSRMVNPVRRLLKQQDHLLYLAVHLILNLSEDVTVEQDMREQGLVPMLVDLLHRNHVDLLTLTITFLKKLSIYAENKDEMLNTGVVTRVAKFVNRGSAALRSATLRLLLNLSFDPSAAESMIEERVVSKLIEVLPKVRDGVLRAVVLKLIYQIVLAVPEEGDGRRFKEVTTTIMTSIVEDRDPKEDGEDGEEEEEASEAMWAILSHLTEYRVHAEALLPYMEGLMTAFRDRPGRLQGRVLGHAMTVLEDRDLLSRYAGVLLEMLGEGKGKIKGENTDGVRAEILRVLGRMDLEGMTGREMRGMGMGRILEAVKDIIREEGDDEVIVEGTALIGDLLGPQGEEEGEEEEEGMDDLIGTLLTQDLPQVMIDRQENDAVVAQVLHTYLRALHHRRLRRVMVADRSVMGYLVDLLQDADAEVVAIALACLQVVAMKEPRWEKEIRWQRFRALNMTWLEAVGG